MQNKKQTNQKESEVTLESLGKIDQKEIELLYWLRTRFRWGEIVIEVRDGLPYRIKKAVEFQTLD